MAMVATEASKREMLQKNLREVCFHRFASPDLEFIESARGHVHEAPCASLRAHRLSRQPILHARLVYCPQLEAWPVPLIENVMLDVLPVSVCHVQRANCCFAGATIESAKR